MLKVGLGQGEFLAAIHRFCHEQADATSPNQLFKSLVLFVVEPSPISSDQLKQLILDLESVGESGWCEHLRAFVKHWPILSPGMHRLKLPLAHIEIFFWFGSVLDGLRQLSRHANYAYVANGFLSKSSEVYALAEACKPGAQLHLPGLDTHLRVIARHAGLACRSADQYLLSGFLAIHNSVNLTSTARVAVIGAGIAGTSVAKRLCQHGVHVTLFEAESEPARGASGNWVGAFHPHITRDHTVLSQLTILGCEYSIAALEELSLMGYLTKGIDWDVPGHLQTIDLEKQNHVLKSIECLNPHSSWVSWKKPHEVFKQSPAGLWFERGGWVRPVKWVQANLLACGSLLETRFNHSLDSIPDGFDAVVIACAQHSLELASAAGYRANEVKGQVSLYSKEQTLPCVLSGHSYAIDAKDSWILLGATYERPVVNLEPSERADQENLQNFCTTYPDFKLGSLIDHRCAVRSVWPDRLPAVGAVDGLPGIYLCTGFASRGLTWAEMAASILLSDMKVTGTLPVSFGLWNKVRPTRYFQS